MSDETLEWELKMDDLMSSPLDKIVRQMASFDKALNGLKTNDFDKALGKKAMAAEEKIADALSSAKSKLTGARADFAQAWSALMSTGIGKKGISPLLEMFSGAGGKMRSAFSAIGGKLSSVLQPAFAKAGTFFGPFVARAKGAWGTLASGASAFGGRVMSVLGPLGSGVGKVFGSLGHFGSALATKIGPTLSSLGKAMGPIVSGFGTVATGLLAVIGGLGAAAAGIVVAGGKWALSGLRFKEDTMTSFKTMLGTEGAASRVFKQATSFAASTPFSSEEVVSGFQKFLTAGFKEDQLDTLMKAVGDVGANMGTDKMNQVITALTQVKAKGKLQGEELMQLAEAGVGQSAVFDALANKRGISNAAAQAQVSGGQVKGSDAVDAILDAIRSTQSGGELGSAMGAKSQTLSGLWSSLMDIPSTLLFASDMDSVMQPIKNAIQGVITAFQEGGPLFKQATASFERIGAAWGKAFGSLGSVDAEGILSKGIGAIESFFVSAAPFAEGFLPEMAKQFGILFDTLGGNSSAEELKKSGEKVAQALGMVATGFVWLMKPIGWVLDKFVEFFEKMSALGGRFMNNDWRPDSEVAADDAQKEAYAQMLRDRASLRGGGDASLAPAGGGGPVTATATVGEIHVHVDSKGESAGKQVAHQLKSDGSLTGWIASVASEIAGG